MARITAEYRSPEFDGMSCCIAVHIRASFLVLALSVAGTANVQADPQRFHAGIARIKVQDVVPFDAVVVCPTDAVEAPFQEGPFTIAPFHPGSRLPREALEDRPCQIHKALDAMLADPRFATRADPSRVGMMGFSHGGAVTLIAAGAVPDLAHLAAYCRDRTDDPKACDGVPTDGSLANVVGKRLTDALTVKALVLMEPWGALFDRNGLTSVGMPTLLYRAEGSDLKAEGNIHALAAAFPIRRGKRQCRAVISYFSVHALSQCRPTRQRSARTLRPSIVPKSIGGSRSKSETFYVGIFDGASASHNAVTAAKS